MTKPIPPPPPRLVAPKPPKKNNLFPISALTAAVIIIIVGGIYLIARHKNNNTITPDVGLIRQMFQPPITTQTDIPQPDNTQLYTNANLGFQIKLDPNWQAQASSDSEIILADQNGPQYSVQAIEAASTSLASIQTQLSANALVKEVTGTTFGNQPALSFTAGNGRQGLAVIYNDRLYYIIGHFNRDQLATFQFLGSTSGALTKNSL